MAIKKIIERKKTIGKTAHKPAGSMKMKGTRKGCCENIWVYLGFGVLFGYFLSKARATDYDTVMDMFLFRDFQLWGVMIVAITVTALGLFLLRWKKIPAMSGKPLQLESFSWQPRRLIGALLFGVGWAMAGACPATALAQIGEGKLVAFVTVIGILAGVWAYSRWRPESSSNDQVY